MAELLNAMLLLLQGSPIGDAVRNGLYIYPVLEAAHIVGIGLLIGPAFSFDLRLLGIGHKILTVSTAARLLLPVSHVGLAIALATGIALLSAQATIVANAGAAPWKLGLLILAGLNALVFHVGIGRRVRDWEDTGSTPVAARLAALVSILAWTGVTLAGRLLAYT